jgi:hypothetical protein
METMKKFVCLAASAAALLVLTACAYDDYDYRDHPGRGDWHHRHGDRDHDHDHHDHDHHDGDHHGW